MSSSNPCELKPNSRGDRHWYPLLKNPVARVLKFEKFCEYFSDLPGGRTVVDYGSGDSPYESMLSKKFEQYIAADYLAANVAHARRPDVAIVDNKLDMPNATASCVVLTEVLEHLYEPRKVLTEINRVLEQGGVLIGTVPFAINEHEQPYDFHRYTFFCLQAMFEESGFEIKRLEYVGDNIGVAIVCWSRVAGIIPKALYRLRLSRVAVAVNGLIRIPELIYYWMRRIGLDPARVAYYRSYPFGFSFMLVKR